MSPHRQTPVLGKVCLDLIDTSKKQSYMAKEGRQQIIDYHASYHVGSWYLILPV